MFDRQTAMPVIDIYDVDDDDDILSTGDSVTKQHCSIVL